MNAAKKMMTATRTAVKPHVGPSSSKKYKDVMKPIRPTNRNPLDNGAALKFSNAMWTSFSYLFDLGFKSFTEAKSTVAIDPKKAAIKSVKVSV